MSTAPVINVTATTPATTSITCALRLTAAWRDRDRWRVAPPCT
jgi:hypothetical protein